MNTPSELRYTETHEWARRDDDGIVTVGITDHAQRLLGDLVFVGLPEVGRVVTAAEGCAVVESVKAASDVCAPVDGIIIEVNELLEDDPEFINDDPYGEGWMLRLETTMSLDKLLDAAGYELLAQQSD